MRRCAGLLVPLFATLLMATCLQGCTLPVIAYAEIVAHDELCRYANSMLPCPNDIVWRGTRSEFYRLTGEVQYGGERIVYDQTVETKYKIGRRRDSDQITRIYELGARIHDPYTLAHRLKDGSALLLRLPTADGLWDDLEGYDTGQYTAEEVARKFRPPDEFLPELSWVDDLETPTLKERYLSEAYYTQPNARLRIVRPFKLESCRPRRRRRPSPRHSVRRRRSSRRRPKVIPSSSPCIRCRARSGRRILRSRTS